MVAWRSAGVRGRSMGRRHFVGGTDDLAAADAAAGEDDGVALRPVVAAGVFVDVRGAAEIAHPDDERGIEQARVGQIVEQRGVARSIGGTRRFFSRPKLSRCVSQVMLGPLTVVTKRVPCSISRSAQVDGATPWQAFRKVIVPLAAPGVFTAAILTFFFAWNDFVFGISLTSTGRARTVPAALAFFTGASQFEQPTAAIAAAAVVVTIPVVAIVLVFQRRIVAGLTSGAVKG